MWSGCSRMERATLSSSDGVSTGLPMFFLGQRTLTIGPALALLAVLSISGVSHAQQTVGGSARVVGTIQAVSGKSLTVSSDSGTTSNVVLEDATKLLQIEPGKTDLKEATPLSFANLQPGDRVLVRGVLSEDGKIIRAASLIAVKKAALTEKQAKERSEWQRGVGGLVKSIDPSASTISITTNSLSAKKEVTVHFTKNTLLRRYATDSTRFDAAKLAPLTEIHPGDQLRARGSRSEGGAGFDADEIVSGTFRNIAGTVTTNDVTNNTLVVEDLATKTTVTLKITAESQMRKLPQQFAAGLAARLSNQSVETAQSQPAAQEGPERASSTGQETGSRRSGAADAAPGTRDVGGDFQQMIARMPAATVADFPKGEVIMVVTTEGNGRDSLMVVTLLGGVEPILRASPKGGRDMILSPWSLASGEPNSN